MLTEPLPLLATNTWPLALSTARDTGWVPTATVLSTAPLPVCSMFTVLSSQLATQACPVPGATTIDDGEWPTAVVATTAPLAQSSTLTELLSRFATRTWCAERSSSLSHGV